MYVLTKLEYETFNHHQKPYTKLMRSLYNYRIVVMNTMYIVHV